jgi:hypothetical protein
VPIYLDLAGFSRGLCVYFLQIARESDQKSSKNIILNTFIYKHGRITGYGKDNWQKNTTRSEEFPRVQHLKGENVSKRRVNNDINRFTMFETVRTSSSRDGCEVSNGSQIQGTYV